MHSAEPMASEQAGPLRQAVARVRSTAIVPGIVAFHERILLRRLIAAPFFLGFSLAKSSEGFIA